MPIKFSLKNTISNAIQYANSFETQIPYAHKDALNDIGFSLRRHSISESPRYIDRPTPWIQKSWRVSKATLQKTS